MRELKYYIKTERSELFEPNVLISYIAELTGDIVESELYEAIRKAWQANESCYLKVVINEDGSAGYLPVTECHNTFQEEEADADIAEVIRREEKRIFRIDEGEMMRVFYFPKGRKNSRLLILAHHLIGDGKSILFFLQDVLNCLSGQQLSYKEMVEVDVAALPAKSRLRPHVQWYCNYVNRKWEKATRIFYFEDYQHLHSTYWKDRESEILIEDFTTQEVTTLLEVAHEHEITLSTLISILLLKNCNVQGGRIQTGFAVDTRAEDDECMSNQVAGISVDMPYHKKRNVWENAAAFQKLMTRSLTSPAHHYFIYQFIPAVIPSLFDSVLFSRFGLHDSALCRSFCETMGYAEHTERTLGITNINRLPIKDHYGAYGIKSCIFIPPAVTYSKRIIGIITDAEGMHITFHGIKVNGKSPDMQFFHETMKELHELCIQS